MPALPRPRGRQRWRPQPPSGDTLYDRGTAADINLYLNRVLPCLGGVSTLSLDSKGRLAIPARHRERLLAEFSGRLVVTLDSQFCLFTRKRTGFL